MRLTVDQRVPTLARVGQEGADLAVLHPPRGRDPGPEPVSFTSTLSATRADFTVMVMPRLEAASPGEGEQRSNGGERSAHH